MREVIDKKGVVGEMNPPKKSIGEMEKKGWVTTESKRCRRYLADDLLIRLFSLKIVSCREALSP